MGGILDWITGEMSTSGRVWSALAPAIVAAAYFLIGCLAYLVRWAIWGPYRDEEIERRGSSVLVSMWMRRYFIWVTRPIWVLVRRSGIPATALTTLSFLLAIGAGVALAAGRFALGGWLYIFAGICDSLDGRLARATGRASPSGAALDSILDRYADAAVLAGLAWYYRDSWVLLAVILALVGSMLVSYVRARGEGLGVEVKVGLMQRPERILYLGATTVFSPILEAWLHPADPRPMHWLTVGGIVLLAVSTQLTAVRRLAYLLFSLGARVLPGWLRADRARLYPLLVGASIATAADFLLMTSLVERDGILPWAATAMGCAFGAVINFTVITLLTGRLRGSKEFQAGRYGFVSLTSTLLNAGGVSLLLTLPGLPYQIAWLLVRTAVFTAWNFPLHRDYVFTESEGQPDPDKRRPA